MTIESELDDLLDYARSPQEQMRKEDEHDLKQFFAKGPVDIDSVRRKMYKLEQDLRKHFTTKQWNKLMLAQSHAYMGEGREEWDFIASEIKESWK